MKLSGCIFLFTKEFLIWFYLGQLFCVSFNVEKGSCEAESCRNSRVIGNNQESKRFWHRKGEKVIIYAPQALVGELLCVLTPYGAKLSSPQRWMNTGLCLKMSISELTERRKNSFCISACSSNLWSTSAMY